MKRLTHRIALAALALLTAACPPALAGGFWSFGIRFGVPACPPRPVYLRPACYDYYYYRPYPIAVAPPPPVIVQPVPVVREVPVPQPVYPTSASAAPSAPVAATPAVMPVDHRPADVQWHLQRLSDRDERVRAESAMQLGRLRAAQAVDPLAATVAGDPSPVAREAAARGLGLIGSTRALPALRHAAQADPDRDVRHSAAFAVEVIQTR
jgi:hypothetical protein